MLPEECTNGEKMSLSLFPMSVQFDKAVPDAFEYLSFLPFATTLQNYIDKEKGSELSQNIINKLPTIPCCQTDSTNSYKGWEADSQAFVGCSEQF